MLSAFDDAIAIVLKNEGGLVDDKNDAGKITNFGISFRFLKSIPQNLLQKYGVNDLPVSADTIRNLTVDQAKEIYRGEFWNSAPFGQIQNQECCNFIFDMAISMGIAEAVKCAQRACWAVMKKRSLPDDGVMGDNTLIAIRLCGFLLMPALRCERAGFYRLAEIKNIQDAAFTDGWLKRAYEVNYA